MIPSKDQLTIFTSILILSFVGLLIIGVIFLVSVLIAQPNYKDIVVINFYGQPIQAKIDGKSEEVPVMQIETIRTSASSNSNIEIYSSETGQLIKEYIPNELNTYPRISIVPVHEYREFCFFEADVTDFYYKTEGSLETKPEIRDLRILDPREEYDRPIVTDDTIYVYPGHTAQTKLPSSVSRHNKVIGVYTIPCRDINDVAEIEHTVGLFTNYSEVTQGQLYEERINDFPFELYDPFIEQDTFEEPVLEPI